MSANAPIHTLDDVERLMNSGQFAAALPVLAKAEKERSGDTQLLYLLGVCQLRTGKVGPAVRTLGKSLGLRSTPEAVAEYALALRLENRTEEAERAIEAGLAKHPGHRAIVQGHLDLLCSAGEHERALSVIESLDPGTRESFEIAMLESRALLGAGRGGEALAAIDRFVGSDSLTSLSRVNLMHRRGDILDELGEFDRAFESYAAANELNAAPFDAARVEAQTDRLLGAWTEGSLGAMRARPGKSELAVFIVGLPRSGTTLVEQIIDCHSRAHGGGELTALNGIVRDLQNRAYEPGDVLVSLDAIGARSIERAGREYLRELRSISKEASRITDKLPSNFRHVGLIASAMPGASIVHTVRDPLDTALSCYFQHFGSTNAWTTSPERIGVYFRAYRRLMAHWASLGIPMHEVAYERMVSDQETQSRALIGHIGLEWEDACLRFHESGRVAMTASNEQVRKPMYKSSVARHEKYAAHVAPFAEAMGLG